MSKPLYIDRGGELVFVPPFIADNVQQYSFLLDADITKLQGVCDKYLNAPLGKKRFVAGGPFVMLSCCALPSLRCTTPPYSNMGWFAEQEIAFWMLVIDTEAKRMYWMLPYIWVDNDYAFAMGRELYGFPKGIGTVTLPKSPESTDLFAAIDTLVLRKFSPDTQGEVVRLVQVNKVEGESVAHVLASDTWSSIEEFVKEIVTIADDGLNLLGNAKLMMDSLEDLLHLRIPMVFLKEFRDVTDPAHAQFQAVVETEAKSNAFHGGKVFAEAYDVNIEICDSHPIRSDLGFAASGALCSNLSFWVSYDFEIGNGTQIVTS